MFERFSDGARRSVMLAQEQARDLRHARIGTEHLLLGLFNEDSPGASALQEMPVSRSDVHQCVVNLGGKRRRRSPSHIPFTPRAKQALELAAEQSRSAGHDQVGTEHLLQGMLAQTDSAGVGILRELGVDLTLLLQRSNERTERADD